jgi:hypothetical protein
VRVEERQRRPIHRGPHGLVAAHERLVDAADRDREEHVKGLLHGIRDGDALPREDDVGILVADVEEVLPVRRRRQLDVQRCC